MAGLCWTAVVLVLLLSTENNVSADVTGDIKDIKTIVDFLVNTYNIKTQVSVAANIPEKQDLAKLNSLLPGNENVQNEFNKESVFVADGKMVAAKPKDNLEPKYTDHAEKRVLGKMGSLVDKSEGHFLVFYTFNSPCSEKCTNTGNKFNILGDLKNILPQWKKKAFVFTKPFQPNYKPEDEERKDRVKALEALGNSIGHDIIFRCPKNKDSCIKCFTEKKVVDNCVDE